MNRSKGIKFATPLALVVIVTALMYLNSNYTMVSVMVRWLIAFGGGLLTFVISYFLFAQQEKT